MLVFSIVRGEFPDFSVRFATEEEFASTKEFPDTDMTNVLSQSGIPDHLIGEVDSENPNMYTLSMFDFDINEYARELAKYDCREYDPHEEYLAAREDLGDFKVTVIEKNKE